MSVCVCAGCNRVALRSIARWLLGGVGMTAPEHTYGFLRFTPALLTLAAPESGVCVCVRISHHPLCYGPLGDVSSCTPSGVKVKALSHSHTLTHALSLTYTHRLGTSSSYSAKPLAKMTSCTSASELHTDCLNTCVCVAFVFPHFHFHICDVLPTQRLCVSPQVFLYLCPYVCVFCLCTEHAHCPLSVCV